MRDLQKPSDSSDQHMRYIMNMPLNLLLVRHGESEGNVANRASRRGDHSRFENPEFRNRHSSRWRLSDQGVKDAQWAGEVVRAMSFTIGRKYSSPYFRAMETMGMMELDGPRSMIVYELRERSWGQLDRLSHEERLARFGQELRKKEEDPLLWEPPGGETMVQVVARFKSWCDTLARECGDMECVVATCHAELIEAARVIIERMLPEDYIAMKGDKSQGIWNGSVLHYTRQDPLNPSAPPKDYYGWVRLFTPPQAHEAGEVGFWWRPIVRPTFRDQDLLVFVEKHAPHIDYS